MPSDMLRELRGRLNKRPFRYSASMVGTGVYYILVRVNPNPFSPRAMQLLPDSTEPHFTGGGTNCLAWHLRCCRDALLDVRVWLKALQETDDNVVFGDGNLPQDLLAEVSVTDGADGEI